jgi:hypothetical protein
MGDAEIEATGGSTSPVVIEVVAATPVKWAKMIEFN